MPPSTRAMIVVSAAVGLAFGVSAMLASRPVVAQATPAPTAVRVASIDLLDVVERMVISERYAPAREALAKSWTDRINPLRTELETMQQQGMAMQQGTPEFQALVQQFGEKQGQLQQAQQQAQAEVSQFEAQQVAEAYALVSDAAARLGTRLGYSHVIASRATTRIRSNNVAGVVQEILARPVVLTPAADDLTKGLLTELGLDQVKLPSELPPVAPADAAAPAAGTDTGAPAPAPAPAPAQP